MATRLIDVSHRIEHGQIESLANLECVVARVPAGHERAISRLSLAEADLHGRAVLVHTGWDRHWGPVRAFVVA
jgi:kynurenine formamidase